MKFEPGTKIGPYQILGELGRGGMATVYRAYQPNLEREVAIKILPEFLVEQPGFKARFHREAVAVARLQHPNILSVFDHGEQDGVTYIVSEYVEGGTLASRMGAPIQLDYCVRILRPIADALDYAHSEGVIHRDVKPSNILLDRRGVPILSDFGLARVPEGETEKLTQTGAMVGTPTYMAPEQCSGGEVGAAADIYALAVIAFEMVTGRVPFTAPNPLGVIAAHQVTPPPSPRKFNPSLPPSIEQPLLAGLAKDPARRPETATDFVEALAAAIPSSASQYPMTPAPMSQGPVPSGVEPPPSAYPTAAPVGDSTPSAYPPQPTPLPSSPQYNPAPSAPAQYTPAPQSAAPPYNAPASPPPFGSQPSYGVPAAPAPYGSLPPYGAPAPAPSYPPAPYATAAATPPPPSYPGAAVQQQYAQAPAYGSQPWAAAPVRQGAAGWVIAALWVGVALGAIGVIAAVIPQLSTSTDDTTRWLWVAFGFVAALAAALSLGAVLGLGARDRWAPVLGWSSVGALVLTVVGLPVAAAVGLGLMQAPRGSLVAAQSRPGGGMRIGGAAVAGALLLLVLMGTTVVGFSQKGSTPVAQATPSPSACNILKPDTAITPKAVGTSCGFAVKSTEVQLDCRSVNALPGPLSTRSWDFNKDVEGGGGTLSWDSAGCHLAVPDYYIEEELKSSNVDPSPFLLVADFVPPQSKVDIGLVYGCDPTGCITTDLYLVDSSVYIGEDSNTQVASQTVKPQVGTNRLVLAVQGQTTRTWFNGVLIATETTARVHGSGYYGFFITNYEKGSPQQTMLLQFGAYRLKQ